MVARLVWITGILILFNGAAEASASYFPTSGREAGRILYKWMARIDDKLDKAASQGLFSEAKREELFDRKRKTKFMIDAAMADGMISAAERAAIVSSMNSIRMELAEARFGAREPALVAQGEESREERRRRRERERRSEELGTSTVAPAF